MTRLRNQIHVQESKSSGSAVARPHLLMIPDVSQRQVEHAVASSPSAVIDRPLEPATDFAVHEEQVTERPLGVRPSWTLRPASRASAWMQSARALAARRSTARWGRTVLIVLAIAFVAFALAGVMRPNRQPASADSEGISANPSAQVRSILESDPSPLRVSPSAVADVVPNPSKPNADIFHVPSIGGAKSQATSQVSPDTKSTELEQIEWFDSRARVRASDPYAPIVDPRQATPAIVAKTDDHPHARVAQRRAVNAQTRDRDNVLVEERFEDVSGRTSRDSRVRQRQMPADSRYESTDPSKYRYPHYSVPSMVRRKTTER